MTIPIYRQSFPTFTQDSYSAKVAETKRKKLVSIGSEEWEYLRFGNISINV
jgi:hypothetical protein